jgi:hypothetical protein
MTSRLPSTSGRLRASMCLLCLVALLGFGATAAPMAGAASSLGESGSLSKLAEEQPEEEAKTTSTSAASSEPRNSSTLLLLGIGAAAVLLIGIVYLIMRDVRGVVPATEVDLLDGSATRRSEAAMRKRRAKAKAARQQRKRNR